MPRDVNFRKFGRTVFEPSGIRLSEKLIILYNLYRKSNASIATKHFMRLRIMSKNELVGLVKGMKISPKLPKSPQKTRMPWNRLPRGAVARRKHFGFSMTSRKTGSGAKNGRFPFVEPEIGWRLSPAKFLLVATQKRSNIILEGFSLPKMLLKIRNFLSLEFLA